jgi:glutamine synthetase
MNMRDSQDASRRAAELVAQHDVHTVECAFPDTWGVLRGKRIPASQFANVATSGFAIANAAFLWDMLCNIFEVDFANMDTGYPDMIATPDVDTFRPVPWRPGSAIAMCICTDPHTHEPLPLDTRHILRGQIERLAAHGYEAVMATELEFYLCDESWQPLYGEIQCYSIPKGAELEHVLVDIRRQVEELGIVVEACNTEYGPAQVEVNLRYGAPLEVADNTALFKYAVKEIARQHGCRATFMAKPFMGFSGNGTHVHLSLRDESGTNALVRRDLRTGHMRNRLMKRVVAGLLRHQPELGGILSPTVNAYKRFEDFSFAPTYVNWGGDNRGVAIRTVVDHGPATRIEVRTASADANPHLVLAAQLAATVDALEKEYTLPPMCAGSGYAVQDAPLMPRSLSESIEALRAGTLVRDAFGPVFHRNLLQLLEHEVEEFGRQVTEWERSRYLEVS